MHYKQTFLFITLPLLCLLILASLWLAAPDLSARQESGSIEVADARLFSNPLFSNHDNESSLPKKSADRRAVVNSSIIHVKADASGTNDGSSWTNAHPDLQDALAAATSGHEIWVAAGTYKPTSGTDRTISFELKNGVAIYGGFTGREISRDQRNWESNVTILSGDLNDNDNDNIQPDEPTREDNSYHVVTSNDTDNSTILDGFTITGGNADANDPNDQSGGGMYNYQSSPTVSHVIFSGNSAADHGGGMYNYQSHPTVSHVTFSRNWVLIQGGGMVNHESSPTVSHVTFSGNLASFGGGMANDNSSPTVSHITFSGNRAFSLGGGMLNSQSHPTMSHVIFSGNLALNSNGDGGGMYNQNNSNTTISNSILWNNKDGNGSGASSQISDNSSTSTVRYSLVQGGWSGTGNIDANPLFVSPISPDDAATTAGNFHLQPSSPAIDAGNNDDVPADTLDLDGDGNTTEPVPFDLDGLSRFEDGPMPDTGSGTSPIVDMGPYEHEATPIATDTPTPTPTPTHTPSTLHLPLLLMQPTPTPTPTPTPVPPLINGDFETGTLKGWGNGGELPRNVTSDEKHSGNFSALLGDPELGNGSNGNIPAGNAYIEQVIQVPSNGTPQLSFWYRVISYDVIIGCKSKRVFDRLDVTIHEAQIHRAGNPECRSQGNRYDSGWTEFVRDLSAYRGQTITLRFAVWNQEYDGNGVDHFNTWAYLDDIKIIRHTQSTLRPSPSK